MHSGSESADSLSERAKDFWQQQAGAAGGAGYLVSDWPPALARRRFDGEWAFVSECLDRYGVGRERCLDVGCGPGLWLERFATVFKWVDGFDTSEQMVALASARLAEANIQNVAVPLKTSHLEQFAGEQRYDFIFVGGVLMYLEDDAAAAALKRLRSLLAPGGFLLCRETTQRGKSVRRTWPLRPGLFADKNRERLPYFAMYRSTADLRALLTENGLSVAACETNIDYKLADIAEEILRAVNVMSGRRLERDPARAEAFTERIYRWRKTALLPAYALLHRLPLRMFRVENHWFLCQAM